MAVSRFFYLAFARVSSLSLSTTGTLHGLPTVDLTNKPFGKINDNNIFLTI